MSFDAKRLVEAQGWALLGPYIEQCSSGRYAVTDKGSLAQWLQESVGDVIANDGSGRVVALELKTERSIRNGNLFLETWSNKNLGSRRNHAMHGGNPGWMYKLRADLLLYYFLDADLLYSIDVFWLKRWAFGYRVRDVVIPGRLFDFEEKVVSDDQINDTWGRPVPITLLRAELPDRAMRETRLRERLGRVAA